MILYTILMLIAAQGAATVDPAAAAQAADTAAAAVVGVADEDALPEVGQQPADAAQLVVYRAYAEPTAWSPTLKVDGVKIIAIPNRHYTVTRIAPGQRHISLAWPLFAGFGSADMDITVEPGKSYFVAVTGSSRYSVAEGYVKTATGIALAEPATAAATIRKCCKFKPAKQ